MSLWGFGSHTGSAFNETCGPHCLPSSAAVQGAFTGDAPRPQCWQEGESGGGFALGGSGYHTSTQFLFSKSVKVCYKTNLVLAQRQPGDNKQTSAPSSEGFVGTQTKRLSDL